MKIRRLIIALLAGLSIAGCSSTDSGSTVTVVNNSLWRDTSSNTIQAHDSVVRDGDTYYWYGTDYADAQLSSTDLTIHFKAIKCYSSRDLVDWKFENNVLVPASSSLLTYASVTAPAVVYNKSTNKWVMWMHYETLSSKDLCLVATCDTPNGNFEVVKSVFVNDDNDSVYMQSLFVDADGTGYVVTSAYDEDLDNYWLYIQKLTDDYLGVDSDWNDDGTDDEGTVAQLFPSSSKLVNRTALFHEGDYYYLMFSTGESNGVTYYATALSVAGPWSGYHSLGSTASGYGELSGVFQVRGTDTNTWMVTLNNWNTTNYSNSKYIMLPIELDGMNMDFDYYTTLSVNATTGVVSGN